MRLGESEGRFGGGVGESEASDGGDDGGGALFHAVEGRGVGLSGEGGGLVGFDFGAAERATGSGGGGRGAGG